MIARLLMVALLTAATVATAQEFPDSVSASKCKGKKKIYGFIDDPTGTPTVRKIKLPNSFYIQAGSAFVQGCKTFRGSDNCRETFGLSLFLTPGFTGEVACGSQSGLPFINYTVLPEDGGEGISWSNTGSCTVTIVKYDEERGRVKGMYRTQLVGTAGAEEVHGELVGCFSAKRQNLGVD
jgi:hypothetical protein